MYSEANNGYVLEKVSAKPQDVFDEVAASQGLNEYVGKRITKINDQDPMIALNALAQEISFYEKEAQARYNEYVTEGIYQRSFKTYGFKNPQPLKYEFDDRTSVTSEYMMYSKRAF